MIQTYCIRLKDPTALEAVKEQILTGDPQASFDPVGNPVTIWVTTLLELRHIQGLTGVLDAILSDQNENPFVKHFLVHHPFVSDVSARLAEEAWDAAINACQSRVASQGVQGAFADLKSTEQRKVRGSL